jgi:hypothetical protein
MKSAGESLRAELVEARTGSFSGLEFLGIARERIYSPGKVDADRAILDAVAARLAASHHVRVISADRPLPESAPAAVIFAMCQGPAALAALRRWAAAGARVINSPAAIANAQRRRMIAAFERHGIAHPTSRLLRTDAPQELPAWVDSGAWLKRGDVHATHPDDVVRVDRHVDARATLRAMRRRGITWALVQRDAAGDVLKFYAVRGRFFACFAPPAAQPLPPADEAAVRRLAEAAGAALGLEVFGGDCVIDREKNLSLIDLNDWPSYAACRSGACEAIASYLTAQTRST